MKSEELKIHIKDRAFVFATKVIRMANELPKNPAGYAIAHQIIRSGTSVGANIEEAQSAFSRKDFIHCMQIALKEARETFYWLRIMTQSHVLEPDRIDSLQEESEAIIRILTTIVKNAKLNNSRKLLTIHS